MTLNHQRIEELLALCLKGNELAQMEVYNRYQAAMYNTALRIVKDTAEAEDVMQESFIVAFNKLHTYKAEAAFGAWLRRIVVNKSIEAYKRYKKITEFSEIHNNEVLEEKHIEDPVDYSHVKATKVLACMEELKPNYKTILTIYFINFEKYN